PPGRTTTASPSRWRCAAGRRSSGWVTSRSRRRGATPRFKKVANTTALIWRMLMVAERRFRRLDAPEQLAAVYDRRTFKAGKLGEGEAVAGGCLILSFTQPLDPHCIRRLT